MKFANAAFDDGLEDLARSLAGRIEFQNGKFFLNSPAIAKSIIEYDETDTNLYLILGPQNEYIAGNLIIGTPPDTPKELSFRNQTIRGESFRIATIRVPYPNQLQSGYLTIQMAETMNGRNELIEQILVSTLVHQLILILLAIICVWLAVNRGLLPLGNIRNAIINRSPNNLTPIDKKFIPEEIRPLTEAINTLMARLENHVEVQNRFLANAAHQLRTPLAGLKIQTDLLMREEIPEKLVIIVQHIDQSVERSVRLVTQLLALARCEPRQLETIDLQQVDLTELAANVAEAFVPKALANNIDLGLDVPDSPVYIVGQYTSLYELLSNLVDNALTYTPAGGRVTVRILSQDTATHLIVEDNGIGIPPEERKRVFERFYRLPNSQKSGSGLGLSIVSEIAQLHHATITINDGVNGTGTAIQVLFFDSFSSKL